MEQNGELTNKSTCSVAKSCHLYAKAGNKVSSMELEKLSRNMQKNQTELLSQRIYKKNTQNILKTYKLRPKNHKTPIRKQASSTLTCLFCLCLLKKRNKI